MRTRAPFWARSVARRPAAFFCLLLLSLISVAVSVLVPVSLRSVQQVALAEAVSEAGDATTSVVAEAAATPGSVETGLGAAVEAVSPLDAAGLWSPATVGIQTTEQLAWNAGRSAPASTSAAAGETALVGVGGDCAGATLVAGRCATSVGEAVVARSAGESGSVGVPSLGVADTITLLVEGAPVRLRVVGVYDDHRGAGRVLADPSSFAGSVGSAGEAAFVVSFKELDALPVEATAYAVRSLSRTVRLGDVDELRDEVANAKEVVLGSEGAANEARVSTGLIGVLDRVGPQDDAAAVILSVVTIEALALAWFAVALAVQRIARARAAEWGLARLRGLPARRWLGSVFLEPSVAILLGGILGFASGIGLAFAATRIGLGAGSPVEPFRPEALVLAAAALAGSLVALVAASVRSSRLSLASLLRETTEPRLVSRISLVAQSVVVVVTVLVVYSLLGQKTLDEPGIGLLAPVLLSVVVGLVAVRLAIVVIRRLARRAPRSLGGTIVGRQLGRAPSVLYVAVMVSIGVSLATFATQDAVLAIRLQDARASAVVGASRALQVQVPSTLSLVDAVRRADPSGRNALAAQVFTTGTGVGRLVAVDTSRLSAVSAWSSSWSGMSASELRSRLAPAQSASMTVRGTSFEIGLDDVASGRVATSQSTVHFVVVVQAADGWHTIDLGSPRDGTLRSPAGAFPCAAGCRVVWIGTRSAVASAPAFSSDVTITSFSTDRQSAASLAGWLRDDRWRNRIGDQTDPRQEATASLSSDSRGLRVSFVDERGSNTVSIAPRDAPEPLPALLGTGTAAIRFAGVPHAVSGIGPDLSPRLLAVIGRAPALPRVLGEGAMVDLTLLQRVTDASESVAQDEVWLAPGDHPSILRALAKDGVAVTGTTRLDTTRARFSREASPRAALLALPVGALALILSLVTAVAVRVIGARARRADWESLRIAGIGRARLRRLVFLESFGPPAGGVVLGLASGLIAVAVTAPRLPLLEGDGAAPPPDWSPAILPLVLLLSGVLLLIAGAAAVGARIELREGRTR